MLGLALVLAAPLGASAPPSPPPTPPAVVSTPQPDEPPQGAAAPPDPDAEPDPPAGKKKRKRPGPRLSPREAKPRGFRLRGHRILPVPTFRSEPSVGLTFGLRGRYVYRPPGEAFDHVRFDLVGRISTRLVQDHRMTLQLRDMLHREEIIDVSARFIDDPVFPYPGVANFEALDRQTLLQPENRVTLRSVGGAVDYQQPFAVFEPGQWGIETKGYARWFVGARFAHDRILAADDSRYQADGNPARTTLRRGGVFAGLAWDSRDNGWSPTRGSLHDVSLELGGPWVASTRHWARANASTRFYRSLGTPKLILANQFLADVIVGDAPLMAMGQFGGLMVRQGIGGRDTGRGYFRRRFIGATKLYSSIELRAEPIEFRVFRRTVAPGLKAFMDVGYLPDPKRRTQPIVSGGPGAYIVWDRFFVFRFDVGFSPEGFGMYLTSSHSF